MDPLITEAMRKAAVAWLTVDQRAPYPVWCAWIEDALYVVSGPGEQPAPGLSAAATATVSARGDHGGLIVEWPATVTRLTPDDPLWTSVVPTLASKRLNSAPAERLARRWVADNQVSRLVMAVGS
jgi:hypothetical protein